MTILNKIAFSVALACAGLPAAAQSMAAAPGAKITIKSCMAMPSDAMMADPGCTALTQKRNISPADVKLMQSCKAMPHDAMMADSGCASLMKMHPNMMQPAAGAM